MITASVGFHCPECAKAGSKQSRTVDARRMLRPTPVVTYALIALNVLVFIVGSAVDHQVNLDGLNGTFETKYSLFTPLVGNGEWYRIITGGFLHSGILHIGLNMWALYVIGSAFEPVVGRARLLLLYAVALLGGGLGVVLLYSNGQGATVGASGAIFGLFGALAVYMWTQGINPLRSQIGMVIGLNLLLTFTIPGISIGGHIGGLITGGISCAALLWGRPIRQQSQGEKTARTAAIVAIGIVCLALAIGIAKARYGVG